MTNLRSYTLALLSWILLLGLHILPSCAWAMSKDEEIRLGKEFVLKAKEHFEFLEEPYPLMFLKELVDLLYEQEANKPFDISIYLLKKGDLNAFAAPGGNLFLFTGLIERIEDLDRLSGVVAHELAHVSFRHISNKLSQSYKSGLATLGGMLLGALVGGAP
ncbi:MAG: M48 family metalloprotease, partial [Desulfatiglandales bacterium]